MDSLLKTQRSLSNDQENVEQVESAEVYFALFVPFWVFMGVLVGKHDKRWTWHIEVVQ